MREAAGRSWTALRVMIPLTLKDIAEVLSRAGLKWKDLIAVPHDVDLKGLIEHPAYPANPARFNPDCTRAQSAVSSDIGNLEPHKVRRVLAIRNFRYRPKITVSVGKAPIHFSPFTTLLHQTDLLILRA